MCHGDPRYHGRMSAARCPRCATPTLVPGHEVHVCTGCGGVWLDAERARRLLAPLGADLQQSAAPWTAPAGCPVCGHGMYICLTRLAGVELDVCGPHGVWFDRLELERVSQAVARITGQPAPQAPQGWVQAQPPGGVAGHGVGAGANAGPGLVAVGHGVGAGSSAAPGLVAGAAVVGVAAVGAAAVYAASGSREEERSSFDEGDGLTVGVAAADASVGLGDVGDVAGDAASGVVEVGAGAAEAAGSVLGSIFDALGSIFD